MEMLNVTVNPEHFEGGALHRAGTVVLTVTGMLAAAKANPTLLASVLYGPAGVPADGILDLYRFSHPTKWFLNLKPDVPAPIVLNLHGKKIDVPGEGVSVEMEHLDKQREKMTIHWLPSTFTPEGAKKLVETVTGDADAEVFKLNDPRKQCLLHYMLNIISQEAC